MARYLPDTAPVWREVDPSLAWTPAMYIQASMLDELRYLIWATIKLNRPKFKDKPPKPTPRPGDKKRKKDAWLTPTESFDSPEAFNEWRQQQLSSPGR